MHKLLSLLFFALSIFACTTQEQHNFVFPSLETQQILISGDTIDFFFEQVRKTDMRLQMGLFTSDSNDSMVFILDSIFYTGLRHRYSESLQESVQPFTTQDKQRLNPLFAGISRNLDLLNPEFIAQPYYMVKTDGRHYGKGTWFTRQRAIVIPEDVILNISEASLKRVLYHEVFHIISRYHPKLREALYQSIGFTRPKHQVVLPESLDSLVLLNPDGVDFQYVFEFEPGLFGMPVIYATNLETVDSASAFFNHLAFSFFAVENGALSTVALEHENYPAFRQNIGTVTNYIIHPDEILADYFAEIIMRTYEGIDAPELSAHDAAIMEKVYQILKNYNSG